MQLQQRPKYNISQRALIISLVSLTNLGVNDVLIAAVLFERLCFSIKNSPILEFQCHFKEVKTIRKILRQ